MRVLLAIFIFAGPCLTQTATAKSLPLPQPPKSNAQGKVPGLYLKGNAGAALSVAATSSVVGQNDGVTLATNGSLTGSADYVRGLHEWRNELDLRAGVMKTPGLSHLVKMQDTIKINSTYLFRFHKIPWLGPYARFQFDSALFPTYGVDPTLKTIDGSANCRLKSGKPLPSEVSQEASCLLAKSFSPTRFRELLGVYANPIANEELDLEFSLAFEGKQTLVRDNTYVRAEGGKEGEMLLSPVYGSIQAGPSFGAIAKGKWKKANLEYSVKFEFMLPLIDQQIGNPDQSASQGIVANSSFEAKASVGVFDWLSLDVAFAWLLEPRIVPDSQVSSSIMLTLRYSVAKLISFGPASHPKPPPTPKPAPDAG